MCEDKNYEEEEEVAAHKQGETQRGKNFRRDSGLTKEYKEEEEQRKS